MQIKTQKQVATLQNKAQKVANNLDEVVIAKGVQHIQVQAGTVYQLNAKDFDAKKINLIAKKVGDDLEVALEEDVIIFDNYFAVCATDLSCLVSLVTSFYFVQRYFSPNIFKREKRNNPVYIIQYTFLYML
jgi:hypothetical protein